MNKPEGCYRCPLYESGQGFVLPKTNAKNNVRLIIQGEAPTRSDVATGLPFSGVDGSWVKRNILANAGVSDEEVLFDHTIRCLEHGAFRAYPTGKTRQEAENFCRQYDVWQNFPGVPILLTGPKSIGMWMADDRVSRWGGNIAVVNGRLIGCTYSFGSIIANLNLLPLVIRHVKNLLRAAGDASVLKHPTVSKGYIPDYVYEGDRSFDLEWNPESGVISAVGVAFEEGHAYATFTGEEVFTIKEMIKEGKPISGHNICTADLPVMGYTPEQIRDMENIFDTMIAAHLVYPHFSELGLLGLSDMVKFYDPTTEWKEDTDDLLEYNGRDCAYTRRLAKHLRRDVAFTKQNHLLLKDQKLAAMTVGIKQRGIKLDTAALEDYGQEKTRQRKEYAASFTFNPNSPKQIKEWAATLKIKLKDTKYETLVKYEGRHPEFDKLLAYKEDSKSLKTWFPVEIGDDGSVECTSDRVYPSYHITGTSVGRPSCSDPNVLNIPEGGPRQMEDGKLRMLPNLRRFFIPDDGGLEIWSFDFSQIENRCIAFLANDKNMLADFASGADIHKLTASKIFNKPYEEVTKDERFMGKRTIHATNYCETPHNLATRLFGRRDARSVEIAKNLQRSYFRAYPATESFQNNISRQLDRGDITLRNPYGRVRKVYAQNSHERTKRGVHYMGCSTAADMVNARGLEIWMGLQLIPFMWVYDELAYCLVKGEEGEKVAREIKEILEQPVPELDGMVIPVGVKKGPNYGNLTELALEGTMWVEKAA